MASFPSSSPLFIFLVLVTNLCSPPTLTAYETVLDDTSEEHKKKGSSSFTAILVVADVIVLVVILFLFIIYYKKYNKLKKEMKMKNLIPKDEEHDSTIVERERGREKMGTPSHVGDKGKLVFVEKEAEVKFELDDLLKASAEGLGKGNFGNCYKATVENGAAVVVVKRLRDLKPLNSEEFMRQVRAIAEQKHPNLLPLLAFYYSKEEKLFMYRFAAHGNLQNRIHGGRGTTERVPFRWTSRLAAARGVARAVKHLHLNTRSQTTAPHGNLKSSNVLYDEKEEILVTDYGLTSLIALPIVAQRMVAYKCPEYVSQKKISKKSDVWSYGALLLELLTGRMPGANGLDLCSWVHRAVREEWTAEIFDPEIAVQRGTNRGMVQLLQIALKCCDKAPERRPEIGEVLAEVEDIKVSAESEDDENSNSNSNSYSYSSLTDDSVSGGGASIGNAEEQR
ncbi:probable inactive receptor kinase At2g26730 [Andrographis paniculata]|uniref:probable inactive receptor kinase At2g26730 n=1 Tax=Andrographis paniculata TaxID=175694 RepID=UPI0021E920CA|nr:probable inactive receptor kinase At2g26730 [Andrographis paniculata]